jgi:hypothetical protein
MGVSTNGQICFGIAFEEGFEFPWDRYHYGDIGAWWRTVNRYEGPFYPFGEGGEYKPGVEENDPRIGEYFDHQREWHESNPVPIIDINYCSGGCPMYILSVPNTGMSARRGYPEEFDPSNLTVSDHNIQSLLSFCAKYGIETENKPKWWLSCYCDY